MKVKNLILIIFLTISYVGSLLAENNEAFDGAGGRDDLSYLNAKNSDFKKGKDALKQALKYKKKDKFKKANARFEKALKYFVLSYKDTPYNIDTLSYLGFIYTEVGDLFMSEIYYQEALKIDPKNYLINQKLGELYLNTKRYSLAKEKLDFLSTCNCQEYVNLKNIIEK